MAHITDGGPAFPCETERPVMMGTLTGTARDKHSGLTMRDYFAAQALAGVLASPNTPRDVGQSDVADDCYAMADEMLRARAAQSPADVQRAHLEEFGK